MKRIENNTALASGIWYEENTAEGKILSENIPEKSVHNTLSINPCYVHTSTHKHLQEKIHNFTDSNVRSFFKNISKLLAKKEDDKFIVRDIVLDSVNRYSMFSLYTTGIIICVELECKKTNRIYKYLSMCVGNVFHPFKNKLFSTDGLEKHIVNGM